MQTKEMKLNSHTLPERVKAKMVLKLFNTRQKELGFALCSKSDNIVTTGEDVDGISDRIVIDQSMCKKDEKYLGSYHTHPSGRDSHASATDLVRCGKEKIICVGGKIDGKIRCNIWKHEQLSPEDIDNMDKLSKGTKKSITKPEILIYQQTFDCVDTIGPLAYVEECIRKIDKDIDKKVVNMLGIKNKPSVPERKIKEAEDDLVIDVRKRDMLINKVNNEVENESKKYYNKVDII